MSHIIWCQWINSLWPSDAIWWHRSELALPHIMACFLMAPNHYLNQYWLIIKGVLLHSPERSADKWTCKMHLVITVLKLLPYSISQEICTRFLLCCGYTLTDFPISIRLTSLALWQSNDCPSASKATLMNMDKYFMWIHYERLHNHNKAKHNKTVCIFLGIYCISHGPIS